MKTKVSLLFVILTIAIVGCTTTKITPVATETPPGSGIFTTNNVTSVVVDPKLTTALGTIGLVNDATAALNPYSAPIGLSLSAIAAIATWYAKRKNDQLNATIAGVEKAGTPEVKKAIMSEAISAGVESALNKSVQKVTG